MGLLDRLFRNKSEVGSPGSEAKAPLVKDINPYKESDPIQDYILRNHWEDLKVIYGFSGDYDARPKQKETIIELSRMIKKNHTISLYKLTDSLNLIELKHQQPPFDSVREISYELMKESELIAFWLSNPAIGTIYGFGDFIPGDKRCIALLASIADMVGVGRYTDAKLTDDLRATEGTFKRYDIVGLFYKSENRDIENLVRLISHDNPYHRYVAVWALGKVKDKLAMTSLAAEALMQLYESDANEDVREEAKKALGIVK